jgi:hypothetical protein
MEEPPREGGFFSPAFSCETLSHRHTLLDFPISPAQIF